MFGRFLAVSDLDRFSVFIRLCAGRTGQLLNMQALGGECGVTHNTTKSWLSVVAGKWDNQVASSVVCEYWETYKKGVL